MTQDELNKVCKESLATYANDFALQINGGAAKLVFVECDFINGDPRLVQNNPIVRGAVVISVECLFVLAEHIIQRKEEMMKMMASKRNQN